MPDNGAALRRAANVHTYLRHPGDAAMYLLWCVFNSHAAVVCCHVFFNVLSRASFPCCKKNAQKHTISELKLKKGLGKKVAYMGKVRSTLRHPYQQFIALQYFLFRFGATTRIHELLEHENSAWTGTGRLIRPKRLILTNETGQFREAAFDPAPSNNGV